MGMGGRVGGWVGGCGGVGVCVCVCVWERERERERVSKSLRLLMKIRTPRPPLSPLNQNLRIHEGGTQEWVL